VNEQLKSDLVTLIIYGVISAIVFYRYRLATRNPSFRYLTFPPRFWALVVDGLVLWPISFAIDLFLSLGLPTWVIAMLILTQSLCWFGYTIVMHARWGQTVGKMVTKTKVVDATSEGRISLSQAILRDLVPMVLGLVGLVWQLKVIVDGKTDTFGFPIGDVIWLEAVTLLLTIGFGAEILTMFTNDKRRALHDLVARTVVIRLNIKANDNEATSTATSLQGAA
jgi:uncharacterized RDD family membrane protein YckC